MIGVLKRIVRMIGAIELAIAVTLLLFIVGSIACDVFFRSLLASPLIWVQEAATISFIWVTFLGAAVASKMDRHVYIATIGGMLLERGAIVLDIFVRVFGLCVAIAVSLFILGYIPVQNRSITISLPINFPRGWVFAIPTLVAMVSIAFAQAVRLMDIAVHLKDGDPAGARTPLMGTPR